MEKINTLTSRWLQKGQGAEESSLEFLSYVRVQRNTCIPAKLVTRTVAGMLSKLQMHLDEVYCELLDVDELIEYELIAPVVISMVGLQRSGVKALLTTSVLKEFGSPAAEVGTSAANRQELLATANIPVDATSLSILVNSMEKAHTSEHNVGNAAANGCVMAEEVGDLD